MSEDPRSRLGVWRCRVGPVPPTQLQKQELVPLKLQMSTVGGSFSSLTFIAKYKDIFLMRKLFLFFFL